MISQSISPLAWMVSVLICAWAEPGQVDFTGYGLGRLNLPSYYPKHAGLALIDVEANRWIQSPDAASIFSTRLAGPCFRLQVCHIPRELTISVVVICSHSAVRDGSELIERLAPIPRTPFVPGFQLQIPRGQIDATP